RSINCNQKFHRPASTALIIIIVPRFISTVNLPAWKTSGGKAPLTLLPAFACYPCLIPKKRGRRYQRPLVLFFMTHHSTGIATKSELSPRRSNSLIDVPFL